jgi:hypothetical protein
MLTSGRTKKEGTLGIAKHAPARCAQNLDNRYDDVTVPTAIGDEDGALSHGNPQPTHMRR